MHILPFQSSFSINPYLHKTGAAEHILFQLCHLRVRASRAVGVGRGLVGFHGGAWARSQRRNLHRGDQRVRERGAAADGTQLVGGDGS
jgi:hypothetical protein